MAKKKATMGQKITEAVVYCRVSTDEQARSGLGLEAQETRCRAWALANGLDVATVFVEDGASAKTLKRPELEKALAALKPGRVLVAYRLDRFTRTQADFPLLAAQIEDRGAEWATVEERFDTSTAMGRAMLQIVLTFSQLEREQTAERTSAALAQKRVRRERLGTTPLGFRTDDNGNVTVDHEEQTTVARARALRAQGLTLRAVAKTLTDEGHRTKRGGAWGAETVRKILGTRYLETVETSKLNS